VLLMKSVMLGLPAVTNWNGRTIPIVSHFSRRERIAWTIMSAKWIRSVGTQVNVMQLIKLNSA
jgi:hypothetical protein